MRFFLSSKEEESHCYEVRWQLRWMKEDNQCLLYLGISSKLHVFQSSGKGLGLGQLILLRKLEALNHKSCSYLFLSHFFSYLNRQYAERWLLMLPNAGEQECLNRKLPCHTFKLLYFILLALWNIAWFHLFNYCLSNYMTLLLNNKNVYLIYIAVYFAAAMLRCLPPSSIIQ